MLITDILQQKNDPERYSIFTDGEFCIGLSAETVVVFGLKKGMEITDEMLCSIRSREDYSSALACALEYAARTSGKGARDFRVKLESKEYSAHTVNAVLERLEELGYVDDSALARDIVSRCLEKGEGELMMRQKLKIKGIDAQIINEVCDIDPEFYIKAALQSYDKAVERYGLEDRKARARVYAALQRKGFGSEIINEVFNINDEDM